MGNTNWELGLTPLTPPLNRRPILSLRRRGGDIVEELFVSPPLSYRRLALTQKAYDDFITPPHPVAQRPDQSTRETEKPVVPQPTGTSKPPTRQAGKSVVLSTSNPPPYEWKAKCAHCTQEIGFNEGPQYKCSTCPNYFLCDICQDIITEEKKDQYEDNDWDYLLPHAPTHSVYKTEVPDPLSPTVLHTSHGKNPKKKLEDFNFL